MADDVGTRIKRARERKRWTQEQLAAATGFAVRSIGSWERGEAMPRNALGILEDALHPYFKADPASEGYTDPDEAAIWAMDRFSETERRELIAALREIRHSSRRAAGLARGM